MKPFAAVSFIAVLFLCLEGCSRPASALGKTSDSSMITPTLQYNWETGSIGEVFTVPVTVSVSMPHPEPRVVKLIVAHVPVSHGSDLRVEFFTDDYSDHTQSTYYGRIAKLVTQARAPKDWLGVSLQNNTLRVEVCEHYDTGCATSVVTTYRFASVFDVSDAIKNSSRSRHKGRPEGATWTPIVPPVPPKPSLGAGITPIWRYSPETHTSGEVFESEFFGERYKIIVVHQPVVKGSHLVAKLFYAGDPDHAQPPEDLGQVAELRTRDSAPRNWLGVHFSEKLGRLFVGVCNRYDDGCPTSALNLFESLNLQNGERYPYKSAMGSQLRLLSFTEYSGPPEGADWTVLHPTPSPTAAATPTPGPNSAHHIVNGSNFDEMTYTSGPCSTFTSHMHLGKYTDPQEDVTSDVEDVRSGRVGDTLAAVVTLHCEFHMSDEYEARIFQISGGRAKQLAVAGGYTAEGGEGFDNGPFPTHWIATSFSGGTLYVDTWQIDRRCDARRDWLSTAYSIKNGRLITLNKTPHHRASEPVACSHK